MLYFVLLVYLQRAQKDYITYVYLQSHSDKKNICVIIHPYTFIILIRSLVIIMYRYVLSEIYLTQSKVNVPVIRFNNISKRYACII